MSLEFDARICYRRQWHFPLMLSDNTKSPNLYALCDIVNHFSRQYEIKCCYFCPDNISKISLTEHFVRFELRRLALYLSGLCVCVHVCVRLYVTVSTVLGIGFMRVHFVPVRSTIDIATRRNVRSFAAIHVLMCVCCVPLLPFCCALICVYVYERASVSFFFVVYFKFALK